MSSSSSSSSTKTLSFQAQLHSHLLGTWRLLSYKFHRLSTEPRPETYAYGTNATGLITYTPDGHVSMHFCNPGQPAHDSSMPGDSSEAELAESARRYLAYAGPFDVGVNAEGEAVVVHHAEVSLYPNWAGTSQRRRVRIEDGGKLLRLWPEKAVVLAGEEIMPTMVWRKVEGHNGMGKARL